MTRSEKPGIVLNPIRLLKDQAHGVERGQLDDPAHFGKAARAAEIRLGDVDAAGLERFTKAKPAVPVPAARHRDRLACAHGAVVAELAIEDMGDDSLDPHSVRASSISADSMVSSSAARSVRGGRTRPASCPARRTPALIAATA
jgi:hypothetical protein